MYRIYYMDELKFIKKAETNYTVMCISLNIQQI